MRVAIAAFTGAGLLLALATPAAAATDFEKWQSRVDKIAPAFFPDGKARCLCVGGVDNGRTGVLIQQIVNQNDLDRLKLECGIKEFNPDGGSAAAPGCFVGGGLHIVPLVR